MLRMFARRLTEVTTAAGADVVMFGVDLPSDTVVHDLKVRVQMIGVSQKLAQVSALMYGVEGYILPIHDPDLVSNYDTLWDQLVPKDTDTQTMDLDTGAIDTTNFFEPGEAEWGAVFDVGLRPEKLYSRQKLLTFGNGSALTVQDNQTPFTITWAAYDSFVIHIRRRLRVKQPSVILFAIAQPNLDDTVATAMSSLAENEWPRIKYAGEMLRRAMTHVLGLVEAGAETPWEEATALLQKFLDPDVHEDSGGFFISESFRVVSQVMCDLSVVGELEATQITTGR